MVFCRTRDSALFLLFFLSLTGCRDKGGEKDIYSFEPVLVKTSILAPGESETGLVVEIPKVSVSLTIMADGGDAGDIDISSLIDPDGNRYITNKPSEDPIGRNRAQDEGQSTVTFTFPHSGDYGWTPGQWGYAITHWDSPNGGSREVDIYTIVKNKTGDSVNINLWLVGLSDYQGKDDPVIEKLLNYFRESLGHMGIGLDKIRRMELSGDEGSDLSYISIFEDQNENGQSDGLDRLFALSGRIDNSYLNIFMISSFYPTGVIGIAGGIPGPQLIQGTAHSGMAVSVLGGLSSMSDADLSMQGDTMAHELGHYLGLFHTTEKNGLRFDPLSDTPECSLDQHDTNGDGIVSSSECREIDGKNLMFWAAAYYPQDIQSAMQKYVLSLAPATHKSGEAFND